MPVDVLGCLRPTLMHSTSFLPCLKSWVICNARRDGDRLPQLLKVSEEFLVSASHQLVLITRRSCQWSDSVKKLEINELLQTIASQK